MLPPASSCKELDEKTIEVGLPVQLYSAAHVTTIKGINRLVNTSNGHSKNEFAIDSDVHKQTEQTSCTCQQPASGRFIDAK
eukprot:scaffold161490_cov33-Prasinocladus_malaysianus.AAC.4